MSKQECVDCCKFAEVGSDRCAYHMYKPARIHLSQTLCCKDDSFTYKNVDGTGPVYVVDSNGTLTKDDKVIGKFTLRGYQWHLCLDGAIYMSGPTNGLFHLPEFELKALTALVNGDEA